MPFEPSDFATPPKPPAGKGGVGSVRVASISNKPSEYQIRLDALKLAAQVNTGAVMTPGQFAEWHEFFELHLRDALDQ